MTRQEMMKALRAREIATWFDLGLFLDYIRENNPVPAVKAPETFEEFKTLLNSHAMAFVTFYFSNDGVSIEVNKYARAFKELMPDIAIHYIAGEIKDLSYELMPEGVITREFSKINGFDRWDLYNDFFFVKLNRGSKEYNELINRFWKETLEICDSLGRYIEEQGIKLLYGVNVHSNPGNLSLALAMVLISEYMGIPIINNAHDYYWEGGHKEVDIKAKGLQPGPRDFFFKNAHLGEVFSIIELIMPWESRSWITVNINSKQSEHVIRVNGHNPANVAEINTAINTNEFTTFTKRHTINTKMKLRDILSNYRDHLYVFNVDDFIEKQILNPYELEFDPFVLGNRWTDKYDFVNNNIILLQPTRIIKRKRIEFNFKIIDKLFHLPEFAAQFDSNSDLTITLLISGHIPTGQFNYFLKIIRSFAFFLETMPKRYVDRVFLAFLFSEFDKPRFKEKYEHPLTIPDLYNAASLILLPSETEGRGLPIIESCSSGIPLVCNRFEPHEVFDEVTGKKLSDEDKLKILSFDDYMLTDTLIHRIYEYIFFPQEKDKYLKHNRKVINKRFSYQTLTRNIDSILKQVCYQLRANDEAMVVAARFIDSYAQVCQNDPAKTSELLNIENRHYLPGYGRLKFMIMLKSLIDPSFFRVEEQMFRGMTFAFARSMVENYSNLKNIDPGLLHRFYNLIDNVFRYYDGDVEIRHDHALNYRHRNKRHYPWQEFTWQEITGLVYTIFKSVIKVDKESYFNHTPHFFVDWKLAYNQLTTADKLGIDNRDLLAEEVKSGRPIALFPGEYLMYELEFFVLQPIRAQLGLPIEQELTEAMIEENKETLSKITIFINAFRPGKYFSYRDLMNYLDITPDFELKLLHQHGIFEVLPTKQRCVGLHIPQLGSEAIKKLTAIKKNNGILIAIGEDAAMMTDMIDMDRFHLGKVTNELSANIMGIGLNEGFVQYIPAGMRTTLAYPAPIQQAKDFSKNFYKSDYLELVEHMGKEKLHAILRQDAIRNGTPLRMLLEKLNNERRGVLKPQPYAFVSGVYADGLPWNGVMAKIKYNSEGEQWKFVARIAEGKPKPVTDIISDFTAIAHQTVDLAWNGGYILNPELVGKLGLPETYIGSPLGLLIMEGEVKSAPLFNKPAMLFYKDGRIDIRRVNVKSGFTVRKDKVLLEFKPEYYNRHSESAPCYYDLMLDEELIPGNGNVIIRLAGNTVKEVIKTKKGEAVKVIPVGLTLSIPSALYNEVFTEPETEVELRLNDSPALHWQEVAYAVEAGPMLIDNGKGILNMEEEGWKKAFSIKTQAARLDYVDMRGPKIAVGVNRQGELMVLVVNGRIRESVGATHIDMKDILLQYGADKAMGFDPGGSATLVVKGKTLNVSPYNIDYELNNYAMPGQPRFVANAILGWREK